MAKGKSVPIVVTPAGRFRAGKRVWEPADDETMRRRFPHEPTAGLARDLGRSVNAIYNRAFVLGLEKSEAYMASPAAYVMRRHPEMGAAYRFKKGLVPANKGLRRPGWHAGRMKETQYKKGQIGTRFMPIGSTRLVDGYVYRKVTDTPLVPWTKNWTLEHRRIWEAEHGPVPAGHAVAFKNGDRLDVRLDNLVLVTKRSVMLRNTVHNLPKELAHTIQVLGALNRQIRRKERDAAKQDRRSA